MSMEEVIKAQQNLQSNGGFGPALEKVERMLAVLQSARERILNDPSETAAALSKLQTPVQQTFEKINDDLKLVDKSRRKFQDTLKNTFDQKRANTYSYTPIDPLADKTPLINRAIAMHLLREGQFEVASMLMEEAESKGQHIDLTVEPDMAKQIPMQASGQGVVQLPSTLKFDSRRGNFVASNNETVDDLEMAGRARPNVSTAPDPRISAGPDTEMDQHQREAWEQDFAASGMEGGMLQKHFGEMYHILHELRQRRNLQPAIEWARHHASVLEARGSNLEFELCRLKFVELFTGGSTEALNQGSDMDIDSEINGKTRDIATQTSSEQTSSHQPVRDPLDGPLRAWAYARSSFPPFYTRYVREIQQLSCGMSYHSNLAPSPYAALFASGAAWEEVAASFAREFCSLLGLSADSPLRVATTAGGIAIPRVSKMREKMIKAGAEWTSGGEMNVEIPLPPSYYFHPIFVCPVSREQATDANPPMMMPCGHVILKESLDSTSKSVRFKCPYCPSESHPRDARQVWLA